MARCIKQATTTTNALAARSPPTIVMAKLRRSRTMPVGCCMDDRRCLRPMAHCASAPIMSAIRSTACGRATTTRASSTIAGRCAVDAIPTRYTPTIRTVGYCAAPFMWMVCYRANCWPITPRAHCSCARPIAMDCCMVLTRSSTPTDGSWSRGSMRRDSVLASGWPIMPMDSCIAGEAMLMADTMGFGRCIIPMVA